MKTETEFTFDSNGIEVKVIKKENYTLKDLRQKLINHFYNKSPNGLSNAEAEVLKILLTKENNLMLNGEEIKKYLK